MAVNGPVPVVLVMGWASPVMGTSAPSPMPTGFVAPKPVPVTVTVAPGAWAVGFSVIDPAAEAVEMIVKANIESIRQVVATVFLSRVFFTSPNSLEVSYRIDQDLTFCMCVN